MELQRLRIGSELRRTEAIEAVTNPWDGSPVGEVCRASARDMDDAISAAAEAFEVTRRLPTRERVRITEKVAALLEARGEEIATLMTRESGKPIRYSRGEVTRACVTFRLAASEALRSSGEVMPIDLEARADGRLCLFQRVSRGPVAAISPFNFPLNLIAHKVAPAIAVGSPVVLKPPPQCPLTGYLLGDLVAEAGWPAGGLNVLHSDPGVAQRMVEDPRLAVLSFTGSDVVGWKLKALAGKKQVLLELGGNAPCILAEDANLDAALPALLQGSWAQSGQVCIKVQRILVHRSLYPGFLDRFVAGTRTIACGDPMDPETVVGPLIEKQHVTRVLAWIEEAVQGGARLHSGGEARGPVVLPTILTEVTEDMRVCKDEVFGPVTVVEPFEQFEDALATCNRSRFGLQAGVFTRDLGRALQSFHELNYGGVMINDVPTFRVDNFPYGGTKDSGFGREGVRFAMEEMTEPRVLVLRGMPKG